ncbi:MAG TPA: hypothetical protein VH396_08135, partial [Chitinophagaceae bacterium]
MKKFIVLFFLSVLFSHSVYAQHKYYFSSKGQGKENGTEAHPYTSLQKLSQLKLQAGDTVFFKAGDKFVGNISLSNINGAKDRLIIFTSYGKGNCIIDAGKKLMSFIFLLLA